jgi:hypothetical protein
MEFTLSDPPAHGYEPGDTLSGEVKYNITAQQETIIDVRLHLDGSVLVHPSKLKYEAHRSNITLVGENQTPFQGPFTLKRQLLVWPFSFVLPATTSVKDVSVPLPPSMDHQFREGIQIRVEYNITATIRVSSDHRSAKQASKIVLVKQPTDPAALESRSYSLSFPPVTLQTNGISQRFHSRLRGSSSRSSADSNAPQQSVRFEMALPLTFSIDRHDKVTCCLTDATRTGDSPNSTVFVLEIAEFALRRRLGWQNLLEDIRHIGTATMRPGVELSTDGHPITLPATLGLRDFTWGREIPGSLTSYNAVVPEVSLEFTITASVVLKHKVSGRRIQSTATLPVVILDTITKQVMPPAYERLEETRETNPPPYEVTTRQ